MDTQTAINAAIAALENSNPHLTAAGCWQQYEQNKVAIAALRAASCDPWRPIATYANNGLAVDLWIPRKTESFGYRRPGCYWLISPNRWVDSNGRVDGKPTHWMPMPAPPETV